MYQRPVPRPATANIAAYLMVGVSFLGFVRGTYVVNLFLHEQPPAEILPYIFLVPFFAGLCAYFIFRGANWARIFFWLVVGPLAVAAVIKRGDNLSYLYVAVYLAAGILLALPNSHWFFMGRDYRRRPGYRADFDRQENDPRSQKERKRFEY